MDTMAIIMAAGEGKRMHSERPKVLHEACGRPIIDWVIDAVSSSVSECPVVVVGSGADEVRAHLGADMRYAFQEKQLGTGHGVMTAAPYLEGRRGYVLVVSGDTPLLRGDTLLALCSLAKEGGFAAAILTALMEDPSGYGRIVRGEDGGIAAVVEHRDADARVMRIKEINASVYCFEIEAFLRVLKNLDNDNAQAEYYLTDCIAGLVKSGEKVGALLASDTQECMGVNDRVQLAEAAKALNGRIIVRHQRTGVTFVDPQNTYVDFGVSIGRDTIVYPGNVFEGNTVIGERCTIYPGCRIRDSVVGNGARIESSVICESAVGDGASIGPFSHLRPGTDVRESCRIGNFVELKKSIIGKASKVSHLTYVGDGVIGEDCNIGCGVVFVNYDGDSKNMTVVEDGAFVGCNANLISPVKVGKNSYIAAGSTITADVPEGALGVARSRQINKEGWSEKRRMEKHK